MKKREETEWKLMIETVRRLIRNKQITECENYIKHLFEEYPDAPQPHNLYGILQEEKCNHILAMRHFRAAWSLDPSYEPARKNMEEYGTFHEKKIFIEKGCYTM